MHNARRERKAAIIHLCVSSPDPGTVCHVRCRIWAFGCQTGPLCFPVAGSQPEYNSLREPLHRSIECGATVGADLHQCDRHETFARKGVMPAQAQISTITQPWNRRAVTGTSALGQASMTKRTRIRPRHLREIAQQVQLPATLRRCVTAPTSANGGASTRKPGSGVAGSGRLHVCRRVTACVHRSLERLGPAPGPRAGPPA
jgi:hypothetical protein